MSAALTSCTRRGLALLDHSLDGHISMAGLAIASDRTNLTESNLNAKS